MKVACFNLFNEIWALELQLELLKDHIDHFVVVEGTKTFAGRTKKLYYQQYRDVFCKFEDRISYVIADDFPDVIQESYTASAGRIAPENRWPLERYSRNAAKRALETLDLGLDGAIFVFDIDEFLSPAAVEIALGETDPNVVQTFYLKDYRNTASKSGLVSKPFQGGYMIRSPLLKYDLHYLRRFIINSNNQVIPSNFTVALNAQEKSSRISDFMPQRVELKTHMNAGWHFSSMNGGLHELTVFKVQNFAHSESSVGQEVVQTEIDYYQLLSEFINRRRADYNLAALDNDLPDVIREYCRKFPVLLQPEQSAL